MTKAELKKQIDGHNRRNRELLEVLRSKGLNEEDQIDAEYHFWVDNHVNAVAFAKRLYDEGFLVLVISPVDDNGGTTWNLEAQKTSSVKNAASANNTEYLVRMASNHDATYDGWGTRI